MKEIILLRHGDTDATENRYFAGWSDIPLSKKGEKRISLAREILKHYTFREIWVSPLIRAQQTAQLVIDSKYPIILEKALMERSFGDWEGKNWEEIQSEFPNQFVDWKENPLKFTPPRGESFADVISRVGKFWKVIQGKEDGTFLVVTHAGVIRSLLVYLTGMTFENCFHLLIDPGVLVKIRQDPDFTQIVSIINHEGV